MTKFWRTLVTGLLLALGVLFVSPLVLMVFASLKPEAEVLNPEQTIPKHWTLQNYAHNLGWTEEAPFGRWLLNSFFISTSVTVLVILFASMGAFGIARLRAPGGNLFLSVVVASMMIPGQLFLVPLYLMLSRLHWLDTPAALIVPATASGFGIFMLTQFMRSVPEAVEEAALLDGCSLPGVFYHVSLPLCAPAIATLGILTFIGSWNDFVNPLIFMDSVRNYTLPVGIAMYQSSYYTEYGLTLAMGALATAPLILVFLAFQRQIVESMASTGLKD
jgi:multiple sugar transport system permease protein